MLSIVFVDHSPVLGGAERVLLTLLKHLDRTCWQLDVVCPEGALAEEAAALGSRVHILPLRRLRGSPGTANSWLTGGQAVARVAREGRASLFVANTVRAALYCALASQLAGIPLVWHMHDFWLSEARPRHVWADRLGKRLLCAASARVLANSQATARHLPCPRKVTVAPNGIEIERFDPQLSGAPFRCEHGLPLDGPVAGVVGRLRPWKGQARFLRAMATVAQALPSARFLVVGGALFGVEDGYPQELRRLVAGLGLSDRVLFTGHLDDVRPALAAMDVFVHPGDPEPFGLVTLEAMAMQKPVVALAHGALPEIVAEGETGSLVPPGDEGALAQAVLALLGNPTRREAMGRAGRARAASRFSARRTAALVEAALAEILAR